MRKGFNPSSLMLFTSAFELDTRARSPVACEAERRRMFDISEPEISVEKLTEIAREGLRRDDADRVTSLQSAKARSSGLYKTQGGDSAEVEIQPLSLQPDFTPHADDRYHVKDLLKYHDRNFIQNAYLAILKRGPDATGYRGFIESLRSGRLNKLDVLARLRYSREGRAKRVQVDGLFLPAALRFSYRIPLVGYAARFVVGLARLPAFISHQQQFEAHTAAQAEQLAEHANKIASHLVSHSRATAEQLTGLSQKLAATDEAATRAREETGERFDTLAAHVDARLDHLGERIDAEREELRRGLEEIASETRERERRTEKLHARLKEEIEGLREEIQRTSQKEQEIRMELALQGQRIARLLEEISRESISSNAIQSGALSSHDEESDELDALYAGLENRFRGTSEEIRERLKVYLPFIEAARAGTPEKPVLDLGTGRGEWLELLRDNTYAARGVDSNSILIAECRKRRLDVVEADLMNYLSGAPADSVGAVTGFHVVEHLPFQTLVRMLNEAVRVVQPGGCLIFETPNPQNVLVGSCNFYLDPTHRNPLPAPVMQFLLESRGLTGVEVIKLNPSTAEPVEGDTDLARRFNQYFYGPMDYAVVGWKHSDRWSVISGQ